MNVIRAVVSHPSKQGNMYRVPAGAAASAIPADFLTGFYFKPRQLPWRLLRLLPRSRRASLTEKLERRRLPTMDDAIVHQVSGPFTELFYTFFKGYRQGNAFHDWLASRWLRAHVKPASRGVFHGFQESCIRSLGRARSLGLTAMLESTLPPSTWPIVASEYKRLGVPWQGETKPSPELLAELPAAEFHIAQSAFAERSLIDYGVDPGRIFRMPLGVDAKRFAPKAGLTNAEPRRDRPFRVLFAGQLSVRKGVHHLLAAWQAAGLKDAELVFAGAPRDPYIRELIGRAGPAVRPLGFVPNVRLHETYQSADLFVFPSLAEGGVYVIYEALAAGLPCIVSANAGSAVRDGVEGFVFPAGDIDAMAARLKQLAGDEALRRTMAIAARARGEHFAWPNFYRRIGIMYREAVARDHRPAEGPMDLFDR